MENVGPEYEALIDLLRGFFRQVEDMAIENQLYFEIILDRCPLPAQTLRDKVKTAQDDPVRRLEVKKQFAAMWKAIESAGKSAFAEEHLNKDLPSEKPN